jgi:hypothetical protein
MHQPNDKFKEIFLRNIKAFVTMPLWNFLKGAKNVKKNSCKKLIFYIYVNVYAQHKMCVRTSVGQIPTLLNK